MEKIRVNMTPIEEVKTIHASQDDNATRKWAFDLYDENGKIDSSSIKEQMIFDSRVGGTEQILPENTSDPTTSPIIADIQYPDSLRSEQTFLYRESPTQEDGQAKITRIKGNTLVWNQLLAMSTGSSQTINGITFTPNNDGSITVSGTATANAIFYIPGVSQYISGHKYYGRGCPSGGAGDTYSISFRDSSVSIVFGIDDGNGVIISPTQNYSNGAVIIRIASGVSFANPVKFYPQLFDLTSIGIDNLTLEEVKAWFSSYYSLPYYQYTTGKLLPFKGEELKTMNADEIETNVISLPTLDFFPTGMKSAGSVYDEITESKAITRIGSVDLGNLDWEARVSVNGNYRMQSSSIANIAKKPSTSYDLANIICAKYKTITGADAYNEVIGISIDSDGNIRAYDTSYNTSSSASAFKTAMSGQYLFFELIDYNETEITTASLVTEKGETPLYYDDELIADCNETISSESGIFDAKIKLMNDETIYSQKIQLHIERKPQ